MVFGASGGKDSVLVGILCKMAADNVTGIIMPCESSRNFNEDRLDALEINEKFGIETVEIDLTEIKRQFAEKLKPLCPRAFGYGLRQHQPPIEDDSFVQLRPKEKLSCGGNGQQKRKDNGIFY